MQADLVDKHPAPTYYALIMASERIQRRIDSLLDEADQAIANEDWPTVASRARAVLWLDSENTDALSYLAAAEQDTGSSQPVQVISAPPPGSAPIAERPTSFANGRYQVKRLLGRGR